MTIDEMTTQLSDLFGTAEAASVNRPAYAVGDGTASVGGNTYAKEYGLSLIHISRAGRSQRGVDRSRIHVRALRPTDAKHQQCACHRCEPSPQQTGIPFHLDSFVVTC